MFLCHCAPSLHNILSEVMQRVARIHLRHLTLVKLHAQHLRSDVYRFKLVPHYGRRAAIEFVSENALTSAVQRPKYGRRHRHRADSLLVG